jgi:hypothetical protein
VTHLWVAGELAAGALWLFAYGDAAGRCLPRARPDAHRRDELDRPTWQRKHDIITKVYGFAPDSFEARTTPRVEAFWCFESPGALQKWLAERRANEDEGTRAV